MKGIIPGDLFSGIVRKYDSDKYNKGIGSLSHHVSTLFCHLGHANSVRDISNGLRSIPGNINYPGCHQAQAKSTVSYVNEHPAYLLLTFLKSKVRYKWYISNLITFIRWNLFL